MNTTELIRKKRNKENLSKEEILFLVDNYTKKIVAIDSALIASNLNDRVVVHKFIGVYRDTDI